MQLLNHCTWIPANWHCRIQINSICPTVVYASTRYNFSAQYCYLKRRANDVHLGIKRSPTEQTFTSVSSNLILTHYLLIIRAFMTHMSIGVLNFRSTLQWSGSMVTISLIKQIHSEWLDNQKRRHIIHEEVVTVEDENNHHPSAGTHGCKQPNDCQVN